MVYRSWRNKEITAKTAMEKMGMTANRFYRTVNNYRDNCITNNMKKLISNSI